MMSYHDHILLKQLTTCFNIFLIEKYWIIKYFVDPSLLNKKSELINQCRHLNKILLMNLKR